MNPHISTPRTEPSTSRQKSHGPQTFVSVPSLATARRTGSFTSISGNYSSNVNLNTSSNGRSNTDQLRMPRFFKRLFKWPQMDFEMAAWEMRSLILSPRTVFRTVYYNKQTRDTWHRPDPSFTHLLFFLLFISALLWSVFFVQASSASSFMVNTLRVAATFVFGHFVGGSLIAATMSYLIVGRLLGPGVVVSLGLPGLVRGGRGGFRWRRRRRRRGLFMPDDGSGTPERLEFGYCFDVSIRAFLPVWLFLYTLQLFFMPLITHGYWLSLLIGNTLYLIALSYYFVILFLSYNTLPFLHHTEFLLLPVVFGVATWIMSLFGIHFAQRFAPILWTGVQLRRTI